MLLSDKEQANIMHRLRIGNSPKQIALNYTGITGIRDEIERIRAEMLGIANRHVMRGPEGGERGSEPAVLGPETADLFAQGKESWYCALSSDLKMLVREICHRHSLSLLELLNGNDKAARGMFCAELRERWAMSFSEISRLLGIHDITAKKLADNWIGRPAVTNPPTPKVPADVLPVLLAVAGEHRVTCYAIIKSVRLQKLCEAARAHFTYRLYTDLGYSTEDVARLFACSSKTVRLMLAGHIEAKGLNATAAEARHRSAMKARYGKRARVTIASQTIAAE